MREASAHEAAILAGALGVVRKEIASAELLQAIERVHRGELSVDRETHRASSCDDIAQPVAAPPDP